MERNEPLGVAELAAVFAIALALVWSVFGPALSFPFLALDDIEQIAQNPLLHGQAESWIDYVFTPSAGYIVPVTIAVERVLMLWGGGAPSTFHGFALCLHAVCVTLTFGLARQLGASKVAAGLATLALAVHPLVVQPLAWAICIKDLLMIACVLAASWAFAFGLRSGRATARTWLAVALFAVLAMLSKPSAVLLGAAFLVTERAHARSVVGDSPHGARFVSALVLGLGVMIGLASRIAHDASPGGAEPFTGSRIVLVLSTLGKQVSHVVWPRALMIQYAHPTGELDANAVLGSICLLVAVGALFRAWARPAWLLPLSVAIALYVPISGVLPFGRVISDSYLYGPLCMLAVMLALGLELKMGSLRWQRATIALSIGLTLALALTARAQLQQYSGGDALWGPVARDQASSFTAHRYYADELLLRGDLPRAADEFVRAMAARYETGELVELGSLLAHVGRRKDAECVLIEASQHGMHRREAVINYVLMLALFRDYTPHFPQAAKYFLLEVSRMRAAGELPSAGAFDAVLSARGAALADVKAEQPRWPRRTCAALGGDR